MNGITVLLTGKEEASPLFEGELLIFFSPQKNNSVESSPKWTLISRMLNVVLDLVLKETLEKLQLQEGSLGLSLQRESCRQGS